METDNLDQKPVSDAQREGSGVSAKFSTLCSLGRPAMRGYPLVERFERESAVFQP